MDHVFESIDKCCGCELCAQICPVSIIQMESDAEGFLYPVIKDPSKCISCHKCLNYCPEINPSIKNRSILSYNSGYAKDTATLKSCSSGGIATVISRSFIKNKGIVYGVKYANNFLDVQFSRATCESELEEFRGSKYVQSGKTVLYKKVLADLREGLSVLVIGLPCEIAALNNITRNHENLYTIELVCHGVTSPEVHRQFIQNEKKREGKELSNFSVRYKLHGWKPYYIFEEFRDGSSITKPFRPSQYGIAFHYLKRPSCNTCRFKIYDNSFGLQADITIGDNHGVAQSSPSFNYWGSSIAITHTKKGMTLIQMIQNEFSLYPDTNEIVSHNLALYQAFPQKKNRNQFSHVFSSKGLFDACKLPSVVLGDLKISLTQKTARMIIGLSQLLGLETFRRRCTQSLKKLLKK